MCGITGLFSLDSNKQPDRNLLQKMTDAIEHRGPDGDGYWMGAGVALGHRRLAIIDIAGGQQPWVAADGSAVMIYNGELYNYKHLRKVLEDNGVKFRTNCDTEVVFEALRFWGVGRAVNRFRGMFAIAFWNNNTRKLTLIRDPMGVKPLYWAEHNGMMRFGSEVKTIIADPSFPRTPNYAAIGNYLRHYRLNFQNQTLFTGIFEVPAGTFISWTESTRNETRYWRIPLIPDRDKKDPGQVEAVRLFQKHMKRSVDKRLMADVPVGAYLSGGIDSSVIVHLMKESGHQKLKTFSIGFTEDGYNEFSYAELVANHLKLPHIQLAMTEDSYFEEIDRLIGIKDAPLSVPNEVPLFYLSRVLHEHVKVVLSGEGADELLAGYSYMVRSPHDYILAHKLNKGKLDISENDRARLLLSLQQIYGSTQLPSQKDQFLSLYNWIPAAEQESIYGPAMLEAGIHEQIDNWWEDVWSELEGAGLNPYERVLHILEETHLSALLLRLDATTMAESVEGRVPYTDRDLIEFVTSLPTSYKLRWRSKKIQDDANRLMAAELNDKHNITKYLLRLSYADVIPPEVLQRPKYAFPVPLDKWMYGSHHDWARERILTSLMGDFFNLEALEHYITTSRGKDEGMKLWMLANLGTWLDMYFN
ncbi:asparagine synthase (glutamine-hydrolyzing) [bacterium]|nr:asparagine synthase (glutamine-hydrolyzing) [bacterium]